MIRHLLHALLVLVGAVALTLGISELGAARAAPMLVADAGTTASVQPELAAIPPPPADAVAPAPSSPQGTPASSAAPDHAAVPEPTVDEVIRLWRGGTPLGAILVALYIGLLALVRFDGGRALKWTASAGAVGLLVESVRAGVTPTAGMWIAFVGTLLACWAPGAVASLRRPADPQRGSIAAGLLAIFAGFAAVCLIALASSCAPLASHGKATASDLVDCSLVSIGDHDDAIETAIRDATDMNGSIDWATTRSLVKSLGWEVGGCAARRAIARLLGSSGGGAAVAPSPDPGKLHEGWERLRVEVLGGRRYLPEAL
jgi:hypothetical protein